MLDESTGLAIVVEASFDQSQGVQSMLGPKGQGVLIAREAVRQFCTNRGAGKRAHQVVIRSTQAISLVVPAPKFCRQLSG